MKVVVQELRDEMDSSSSDDEGQDQGGERQEVEQESTPAAVAVAATKPAAVTANSAAATTAEKSEKHSQGTEAPKVSVKQWFGSWCVVGNKTRSFASPDQTVIHQTSPNPPNS